jgi:hypothetical protein
LSVVSGVQLRGAFDRCRSRANWLPTDGSFAALACGDLDNNCGPDIVTAAAESFRRKGGLRIAFNRCMIDAPCDHPGDFNTDGLIDGEDIQYFTNVYFDPGNATAEEFCTADLVRDLTLDTFDVQRFVCILLGYDCGTECPTCGSGGESFSALGGRSTMPSTRAADNSGQAHAIVSQPSASTQPTDPRVQAMLDWLDANDWQHYMGLSEEEYVDLLVAKSIEFGLIDHDPRGEQP